MIDLEFLALGADASVIQIAAILFNKNGPVKDGEFSVYINEINGTVDMSTLTFWSKQCENRNNIFHMVESKGIDTASALIRFDNWIHKEIDFYGGINSIWAKGTLDFPLMDRLYKEFMPRSKMPWNFWDECDLRTLMRVTDTSNGGSATHEALADCKKQIAQLLEANVALIQTGTLVANRD